jgi:large subunit ribosomal protein L30
VKLRITLVRSPIGRKPEHRRTVAALGLKRMHHTIERERTDALMGMVNSVSYLLRVEEID